MQPSLSISIPHVLLVEDDDVDAEMVYRSIARHTNKLSIARVVDGIEALEILQPANFQVDAIVLSLHLPRMDGFEFLVELRSDPRLAQIPVLVLCGESLPRARRRSLIYPVVACVLKSEFASRSGKLIALLLHYLGGLTKR